MHDLTAAEGIAAESWQTRADRQVVVNVTLRIVAARARARVGAPVVDARHDRVALRVDGTLRSASRWRAYVIRKTSTACVTVELLALGIRTTR